MSGSKSSSTQTSTTNNIDRRIATGSGSIFNLSDNTLGSGNKISITTADPAIAQAAINAVANIASSGLGAAVGLTQASNEIAAQVADSQRAFVETATGQKTILYVVGGLALAGIAFVSLRK